jgi:opacity protein-like surface antigen
MRTIIGIVIAASLSGSAVAAAADLPVRAPAYPRSVKPPYDWSGLYLGANVGGA